MAGGNQAAHRHARRRAGRGAYRMVLDDEAGGRRQAQLLVNMKIDVGMRLAPRNASGAVDMLAEKAGEAEAAEHGVEPCPLARRSDGEPPVSLPIEERFQAVDRRHLSRVRFDGSIDKRAEHLTIERAAAIQRSEEPPSELQ